MVSIVVGCYISDSTEYDGRISELSNAALHMKLDANSAEKWTLRSWT